MAHHFLLLLAILVGLLPGIVTAATAADKATSARPYFITTGVASSLSLDTVKRAVTAAYQAMNYAVRYETLPVRRGLIELNEGRADADLGRYVDSFAKEYPNIRLVSTPIIYMDIAVYARADSPPPTRPLTWAALSQPEQRLGAVCASSYLTKRLPSTEFSCGSGVENAILMLGAGHIDWLILPRLDARESIAALRKRDALKDVRVVELGVLGSEPIYHYVHERHAHLMPALNKAFGNEKHRAAMERRVKKLIEELPLR